MIRAASRSWPLAAAVQYDMRPPNRPRIVHRGPFLLNHGRQEWQLKGAFEMRWFPHPTVAFRGRVIRGEVIEPEQLGDDWTLTTPGEDPISVSVLEATWGAHPEVSGDVHEHLRLGRDRPVRALRLHIANFHKYVGAHARYKNGGGAPVRLTLESADWIIQLDQAPDSESIRSLLNTHGGYAVGHVGMLARRDGNRFRRVDSQDILTCLLYFLSFSRGLWCGPMIVEGVGARRSSWTEWRSRVPITDWRDVPSWFPTRETGSVGAAFAGFCDLWKRGNWGQALPGIIHWYVEANLNAGAIEGALVLAHAVLERLAWAHLVTDGGRDEKEFDQQLKSGERIEALLNALGIPPSLPSSWVPDLEVWARGEGIVGGPWAVSAVRDTLIHPRRRQIRAATTDQALIQACYLALSYVELTILALSRYNGPYVNRLRHGVMVFEAMAPVPWAPAPVPRAC